MNTNSPNSITTDTTNAVRTLSVSTVPATAVAAGYEQVTCNTRAAKGAAAMLPQDKSRSIVIPELRADGVPSKLQALVLDALRRTARQQLNDIWTADAGVQAVPAAIWSVDSLLLYAAKKAESQRLTKDTVSEWFLGSKLCQHLMSLGDAKKLNDWKLRIVGLAAPTLELTEQQCTVTIASIGKFEEDAEHIIGKQLIAKLGKRIAKLAEQVEELDAV